MRSHRPCRYRLRSCATVYIVDGAGVEDLEGGRCFDRDCVFRSGGVLYSSSFGAVSLGAFLVCLFVERSAWSHGREGACRTGLVLDSSSSSCCCCRLCRVLRGMRAFVRECGRGGE